jgi:hypothetical protein
LEKENAMKAKYKLEMEFDAPNERAARRKIAKTLEEARQDLKGGLCGGIWHSRTDGGLLGFHLLKLKRREKV